MKTIATVGDGEVRVDNRDLNDDYQLRSLFDDTSDGDLLFSMNASTELHLGIQQTVVSKLRMFVDFTKLYYKDAYYGNYGDYSQGMFLILLENESTFYA